MAIRRLISSRATTSFKLERHILASPLLTRTLNILLILGRSGILTTPELSPDSRRPHPCQHKATSSTEAIVYFYNDSACTYASFSVTASPYVSLVGNCAKWISRESSVDQPTTSYLGATFFFDCLAIEEKNNGSRRSRDLTNATFLEAVQDDEVLSTGRQDLSNNKVVGIVAEDRTNWTKISH